MGCPEVDVRQVRLQLLTRTSCPKATRDYDISCVSSFDIRLVSEDGRVLAQRCTGFGTGRYATLQDLVASRENQELLRNVKGRKNAHLEYRAYFSFDLPPCEELREDDLMLWGRSDSFDMNDALDAVAVEIECRPLCDCGSLSNQSMSLCPLELQPGVCGTASCAPTCARDSQCFGGRLACVSSACTAIGTGLCAPCVDDNDCDTGLVCARNIQNTMTFCTELCPPQNGVDPCPPRMGCQRLDGIYYERVGF